MIYGLIALCIVGIAIVAVLVYRRHQDKVETAIKTGAEIVEDVKKKL